METSDLVDLPHITAETVEGTLEGRFRKNEIYTNVGGGRVLLAMNPFKSVNLYEDREVSEKPHVYRVARKALEGVKEGKSQTIVVSGESGAGKTESTKYVLKYLKAEGVMESNPLLEAFGNARSLRNDNSSRFGKHVKLSFSLSSIKNTSIETYLLEKIRVCKQAEGERNFHIFYQLCAAATVARRGVYTYVSRLTRKRRELRLKGWGDLAQFNYLTQSSVGTVESIDDLGDLDKTLHAMEVLGMEVEKVFGWLAAILNLGNVDFEEGANRAARVTQHTRAFLTMASELLEVQEADLESAMCKRKLSTGSEKFQAFLDPEKAKENRDAFARHLYLEIFNFVVRASNSGATAAPAMPSKDRRDQRLDRRTTLPGPMDIEQEASISVYDIFGFEKFPVNGFEQLCINFANERLQKIFTDCVIGNEQKIMASEGLDFEHIEFSDNQGVLDLLEQPGSGIFPLLDEEARIVGGSDGNFLAKLAKSQGGVGKHFQCILHKKHQFQVMHFAGPVVYSVESFVDKNKDTISSNMLSLIPREIVSQHSLVRQDSTSDVRLRPLTTVSAEFRSQLARLVGDIQSTEPHFIRCIKPNTRNLPNIFDHQVVHDQLVYGGVLHALALARTGYPVRVARHEFIAHYRSILNPARSTKTDELQAIVALVEKSLTVRVAVAQSLGLGQGAEAVKHHAIGKTKVFMRQEFFEKLSEVLSKRQAEAAAKIQATYRARQARKLFLELLRKAVSAQTWVRTVAVKTMEKRALAATRIQSIWRMSRIRRKFKDEIKWRAKESSFRMRTCPLSKNIPEFAKTLLKMNSRVSLAPELNVPQMVGQFRQTQQRFAQELGREGATLSNDDIARKMQDFQFELENAKRALNSVEEKITASRSVRQTLVVGAYRRTLAPAFNGGHLEASPAANFSRRVVAFSAQARAQADSMRIPEHFLARNDRIAQEEAEMKRLLGRIQNELAKPPVTPKRL